MKVHNISKHFLWVSLAALSCATSEENVFHLANNLYVLRQDEEIVIKRSELKNFENEQTAPLVLAKGDTLPSQTDDLDGDGTWDELAFLASFEENEEVKVQIVPVSADALPSFKRRTNIRLGKRVNDSVYTDMRHEMRDPNHIAQSQPPLYQMEGPAWENDKVGFRSYFDHRNGKDIFGKTTSEMSLDPVGIGKNHYSYHKLAPWGMDILKVGNSLGAGALAMINGDSLVRLSGTDSVSFKIITEGSVRAIFTLSHKNWQVGDEVFALEEQITIWAGKYFYESKVSVSGLNEERNLVTGMVNKYAPAFKTNTEHGFHILSTFDKQSENKDYLGMAVISDDDRTEGSFQAPNEGKDVTHTYYSTIQLSDASPARFYFVAGWEKSDSQFASEESFLNYLKSTAEKLHSPIAVSL